MLVRAARRMARLARLRAEAVSIRMPLKIPRWAPGWSFVFQQRKTPQGPGAKSAGQIMRRKIIAEQHVKRTDCSPRTRGLPGGAARPRLGFCLRKLSSNDFSAAKTIDTLAGTSGTDCSILSTSRHTAASTSLRWPLGAILVQLMSSSRTSCGLLAASL